MKKIITMTLLMSFTTLISFTQSKLYHYVNGVFYTKFTSGIGEDVIMEFKLSTEDIINIKESMVYKDWLTKFNVTKDIKYKKRWKNHTPFEVFLVSKTLDAEFKTSLLNMGRLKNSISYTPIKNGNICFLDYFKEIIISFPWKAQNGYGNFVLSKSIYSLKWSVDLDDFEGKIKEKRNNNDTINKKIDIKYSTKDSISILN